MFNKLLLSLTILSLVVAAFFTYIHESAEFQMYSVWGFFLTLSLFGIGESYKRKMYIVMALPILIVLLILFVVITELLK